MNKKLLITILIALSTSCTTPEIHTEESIETIPPQESTLEDDQQQVFSFSADDSLEKWVVSDDSGDIFQSIDNPDYENGALQITLPQQSDFALRTTEKEISNVKVQTVFDRSASNTNGGAWLFCRFQDLQNTYRAGWSSTSDGISTFSIIKIENGDEIMLNSSSDFQQNEDIFINYLTEPATMDIESKEHELLQMTLACHDDLLLLYVNDALRVVANDSQYAIGKAGFGFLQVNKEPATLVLSALDIYDLSYGSYIDETVYVLGEETADEQMPFEVCNLFSIQSDSASPFQVACQQYTAEISCLADESQDQPVSAYWGFPLATDRFILEANITSLIPKGQAKDMNQYGFFFMDDENVVHKWQMESGFYQLTEEILGDDEEQFPILNTSFSPSIQLANRMNQFRLVCQSMGCEYWVNSELIAKTNTSTPPSVKHIGFFSQKQKDEFFGSIRIENIRVSIPLNAELLPKKFSLVDDLRSDKGTFNNIGLSGAFRNYEEDGFHFSPVVPYGYYGVKTQPAMQNMSISAKVKLNPEHSSQSMYGGLTCRASQDGMYIAVIRNTGKYSIFRDNVKDPLTLIAQNYSDAVQIDGTPNHLQLDCKGNTIRFYINGILVGSIEDDSNLQFGRAGFFTKAGQNPHEDAIVFSDFSLEEL